MEISGPISKKQDAGEEASSMLAMRGDSLAACLDVVGQQLGVIQTRSQLLLTLATLTFTITGFSGPMIARTNAFARDSIVLGLFFVLLATVLILLGSLQVQWVTQIGAPDARTALTAALRYRNRKTALYRLELCLLVIGLSSYVASVVTYLLHVG